VQDGYAYWSNVGDCRLYLLREGRVLARTRDDTVVQQLVDEGRIREEAIASHPERNRLLQTLGGYQAPRPAGASARLAKKRRAAALLGRLLGAAHPPPAGARFHR